MRSARGVLIWLARIRGTAPLEELQVVPLCLETDSSRPSVSVSQLRLNSGKSLELRFIHIPSQENQQADRLEREGDAGGIQGRQNKQADRWTDRQT